MVHLTYNNLDALTQEQLMANSKKDVVRKFGDALLQYSQESKIAYETLLEEEAIKNLYSYKFSFQIEFC